MFENNIEIIERQTDLNRNQIIELLEKYDNNVEKVIRYYLNDSEKEIYNNNDKQENNSLNQRIFGEIRNYMDNIMNQYNERKKQSEIINQTEKLEKINNEIDE